MRKLKLIGFLVILVSSVAFIQCTTETIVGPQGIAGIDGIDGTNGTNGSNGTDGVDGVGTASCIECHSTNHRDAIDESYYISGHATGTSWARGKSASCAQCHNNEGFKDFLSGNFVDEDGFQSPNPAGYAVSNAITCTGCHSDHRSFDFANDGNDFALRNLDAVYLMTDRDLALDMTNSSDVMGKSNTCIVCHQPRKTAALDADEEGVEDGMITLGRYYGPHYGAQSTLLEGIQGVEIEGSITYPAAGSAKHRQSASCVSCHMGEPTNGEDGSHTWVATLNACATCHGDADTLKTNFKAEVDGYMAELEVLFEAQGLLVDGSEQTGVDFPVTVIDAFWNYKFIYYDHSHGVHNPPYTKALLKNSIEALEAL